MRDLMPHAGIAFEFRGVWYPSVSEFCRVQGVGYSAMQRLMRKYVRARRDPAVAANWLLCDGVPAAEPVTMAYRRDAALSRHRAARQYQRRKRVRAQERARRNRELLGILG